MFEQIISYITGDWTDYIKSSQICTYICESSEIMLFLRLYTSNSSNGKMKIYLKIIFDSSECNK